MSRPDDAEDELIAEQVCEAVRHRAFDISRQYGFRANYIVINPRLHRAVTRHRHYVPPTEIDGIPAKWMDMEVLISVTVPAEPGYLVLMDPLKP